MATLDNIVATKCHALKDVVVTTRTVGRTKHRLLIFALVALALCVLPFCVVTRKSFDAGWVVRMKRLHTFVVEGNYENCASWPEGYVRLCSPTRYKCEVDRANPDKGEVSRYIAGDDGVRAVVLDVGDISRSKYYVAFEDGSVHGFTLAELAFLMQGKSFEMCREAASGKWISRQIGESSSANGTH